MLKRKEKRGLKMFEKKVLELERLLKMRGLSLMLLRDFEGGLKRRMQFFHNHEVFSSGLSLKICRITVTVLHFKLLDFL